MAGTIDSAIERERDKDPGRKAEKRHELEREEEKRRQAQRKKAHDFSREMPETD